MKRSPWLLLSLQFLAFWPVWKWYCARITDGSDEPWGLLPLITAFYFGYREWKRGERNGRFTLPSAALAFGALYALSYGSVPPLVRAIFAVCSLGATLSQWCYRRPWEPGFWGLLFLSLPLIATMQFYIGYPVRSATAAATALGLQLAGIEVRSQGAMLSTPLQSVWVDAPCSGVKMLWMASYLSLLLIISCGASRWPALRFSILASLLVFLANCTRAAFLFFLEVSLPEYPKLWHSGIGLLSFASVACVLLFLSRSLKASPTVRATSGKTSLLRISMFLLTFAVAGCVPWLKKEISALPAREISWPQSFEGLALQELPLSEREQRFAEDFPGSIRRFKANDRELILRAVLAPSRKLHPSSDCLRAVGYSIENERARILDGNTQSCFEAVRGKSRLEVCEFIESEDGKSYPDVSSWYWSTTWSREQGPWMAYTVSRRIAG